jgi:tRNA 2-(methylsulfanyl)-N6-isopentenyladenosine37 hydroxylase
MSVKKAGDLPLLIRTPRAWAEAVLRDPLALLSDHAHLEKKAAANALELLNRWPAGIDAQGAAEWVRTLTAIARDEVEHLAVVTRLIERRGGALARLHKNPYANALRGFVRLGSGNLELLDRLLVSALIELRSCERFGLLSDTADADLAKLYRGLYASEHGHYLVFLELARLTVGEREVFLELARLTVGERDVSNRWRKALEFEASVLAERSAGPSMHSGWKESATDRYPAEG